MPQPTPQRPVDTVLRSLVVADDLKVGVQLVHSHVALLRQEIARLQAVIPNMRRMLEAQHEGLCKLAAKLGGSPPPALPDRNDDENELLEALESAECVIRQVSRDAYGEELSVKEYADRAGYDS